MLLAVALCSSCDPTPRAAPVEIVTYAESDGASAIIVELKINSYRIEPNYLGRTGFDASRPRNDIGGSAADCSTSRIKCFRLDPLLTLTWPLDGAETWQFEEWRYRIEASDGGNDRYIVHATHDSDPRFVLAYTYQNGVGVTAIATGVPGEQFSTFILWGSSKGLLG